MPEPRTYVVLNAEGVRRLMAKRNVNNRAIAKSLRTTPNYWSQLLNGHRRPSPKLRTRILALRVFRGRGCRWEDIFVLQFEVLDV